MTMYDPISIVAGNTQAFQDHAASLALYSVHVKAQETGNDGENHP